MIDQITCLDKFQFVHDEVVQYDDSCGMFVGKNFHGRIANVTLENGLEVCAVKDNTQSHFGVALSIKAGSYVYYPSFVLCFFQPFVTMISSRLDDPVEV